MVQYSTFNTHTPIRLREADPNGHASCARLGLPGVVTCANCQCPHSVTSINVDDNLLKPINLLVVPAGAIPT